ncbi:MAG: trehalose-phosphatase [Acidimicrobiales bacterium]
MTLFAFDAEPHSTETHKKAPGKSSTRKPPKPDLGPLEVLLDHPSATAVMVDFDGTLAPIVADPEEAKPVSGSSRALRDLAEVFGRVAVISGRPASFLKQRLRAAGRSLHLFGLYGLEEVEDGEIRIDERVLPWLPTVAGAREAAERCAPSGAGLEDKTISLTIHWRNAPEAERWALGFAQSQSERVGLMCRVGRMSVELLPPIGVDKGTVVSNFAAGMHAACYFGDDSGDLDAFSALDALSLAGTSAVRIAVGASESPPELIAAADLVVADPEEVCLLLKALALRAGG